MKRKQNTQQASQLSKYTDAEIEAEYRLRNPCRHQVWQGVSGAGLSDFVLKHCQICGHAWTERVYDLTQGG